MELTVKITDFEFDLAKKGIEVEFGKKVDEDKAKKFLEDEMEKVTKALIQKTYGCCKHCKQVFVKVNRQQLYCNVCKMRNLK